MGVLVTGGCGFVGLNVLEALRELKQRVIALDRHDPPDGAREMLEGSLRSFVRGDVCDATSVEAALVQHGVDTIVHLATVTSGAARERDDPASIVQVNVKGTVNVIRAAKRAGCR